MNGGSDAYVPVETESSNRAEVRSGRISGNEALLSSKYLFEKCVLLLSEHRKT